MLCVFTCTGSEIDGSRVEVVWAKPVDKNDPTRQKKAAAQQQAPLIPNPFLPVCTYVRDINMN